MPLATVRGNGVPVTSCADGVEAAAQSHEYCDAVVPLCSWKRTNV